MQSELESYRLHMQLLNQKNSGVNYVLRKFDSKLHAIMKSLGNLQQKQNVKVGNCKCQIWK